MLDKREARYRVLEYVLDFLNTDEGMHDNFISDCSETEEDAKLLQAEFDYFRGELQGQIEGWSDCPECEGPCKGHPGPDCTQAADKFMQENGIY